MVVQKGRRLKTRKYTNREIECMMSHYDDSFDFWKKIQSSKKVSGLKYFWIFFGFRKFSSNNLAIFLPKRFSNNRLELPRFHFRVKIFDHFLTIFCEFISFTWSIDHRFKGWLQPWKHCNGDSITFRRLKSFLAHIALQYPKYLTNISLFKLFKI